MGRSSAKRKTQSTEKSTDSTSGKSRTRDSSPTPRAHDKDTSIFIAMSQELKEEGNKLFQIRDCEGALLKYEKALKLLPRSHIDVAYLRSNMAACYMQMGIIDYPRAIHECNLALEVSPKYTKALIKRARCYEGLNRLELALRDLNAVLSMESNNLTALELVERVKQAIESRGDQRPFVNPIPDHIEPSRESQTTNNNSCCRSHFRGDPTVTVIPKEPYDNTQRRIPKDPLLTTDSSLERMVEKRVDDKGKKAEVSVEQKCKSKEKRKKSDKKVEKKSEYKEPRDDKVVVEERITTVTLDEPKKNVKLVLGEDIRLAQLSMDCSLLRLREVIQDRFPTSTAVLVKYKDDEGDMITITNDEELRWAEKSGNPKGSVKLYIVEVSPEHDPFYEKIKRNSEDVSAGEKKAMIEEWIIQFARLFKNYVGFSSDSYLDLHELGVRFYSEAMEETVTSEEAQTLFNNAAEKFQEMTALALFNWGNVHMARARKKVHFMEESSEEVMLDQVKNAYDWSQQEYAKAGVKYEEALKMNPSFYEGHLALAQQQFEKAKLAWYYIVASTANLDSWPSAEVLDMYNCAEENIAKGMLMWEESEKQRQDIPVAELTEEAVTIRSQINVLWGTMLYERSIMEFKLGVPVWHECLEVSIEKFELAGASRTDIAVMIKNHCSNDDTPEGIGFRIDEIVQAWNDMDEAKRWYAGTPSFRLEPLLRRRMSRIYCAFNHA